MTRFNFIRIMLAGVFLNQHAYADADGPDYFRVNASGAVELHESAGADSQVTTTVPANARGLKNLGCAGVTAFAEWSEMNPEEQQAAKQKIWCRVSVDGQSGWIQNLYLAEDSWPAAPSYDCTLARGEVEHTICGESGLMDLDNMMAVVYRDSLAVASGLDAGSQQAVSELKATQRGWISGRNECWKEPEDKNGCIADSYEQRISRLQAEWALVEPFKTVRFECIDPRDEFYVAFYNDSLRPSAIVKVGDRQEIFVQAISASGARYSGDFGRQLWIKGNEARLIWEPSGPEKTCTTR